MRDLELGFPSAIFGKWLMYGISMAFSSRAFSCMVASCDILPGARFSKRHPGSGGKIHFYVFFLQNPVRIGSIKKSIFPYRNSSNEH